MSNTNDNKPELSEDELIDAALAALDKDLPASALPEHSEPTPESSGSPTLDALDESRRPKASTVCERCPNSVWFTSSAEVKCYCRVMFLVTWSTKEPNQITNCDGELLGRD